MKLLYVKWYVKWYVKCATPLFLGFLFLVGAVSPSYGKSSAAIVFSGEMRGNIEPCAT